VVATANNLYILQWLTFWTSLYFDCSQYLMCVMCSGGWRTDWSRDVGSKYGERHRAERSG